MKPCIFRTTRKDFQDCLDKVQQELSRPIDKHSKRLIARNIELLLDYCMRFYERQFVTRSKVNKDVLMKFEDLLDVYFQSEQSPNEKLPTVKYFADKVNLSSNYFGDLIKRKPERPLRNTFRENNQYSQRKDIGFGKTVSEIAYELGFQYPQHFTRIFKKVVGCTPTEYRVIQV